ncbi:cytochrome C peroxidase [Catenovulum sp. SM1970]|uniref:cytochrome-c peroxidase n=1 Tax=Marinifaba aquimaris TaxID=2741323 RepID=UPI00157247FE|nr:cytochrome c peroxidase [Marinifaba aquimaris]NTS77460.1 cytochrome C peroxidase [Marinifaba aquimaris]
MKNKLSSMFVLMLGTKLTLAGAAEPPRPNPEARNAPVNAAQNENGQRQRPERDERPIRPENRQTGPQPINTLAGDALDQRLAQVLSRDNLRQINANPSAVRTIPSIEDAKAQLGKALFFTDLLSGEQDVACVSCHHPMLGGADQLSLAVGVKAVDLSNEPAIELLGHGRFNGADLTSMSAVPRNSPTVLNVALFDNGLFWDSRVEVRGRRVENTNGVGSAIITPDSGLTNNGNRRADDTLTDSTSLVAAQARFPVTSVDEMRASFASDQTNQQLRSSLASRFDNSDENFQTNWPALFNQAYPHGEISYDRIAEALAEYQRSMTFVDNPWFNYLQGDLTALSEQQKRGALVFFSPRNRGGAGCVRCHSGDNFSDERHHLVGFPQIGVGKGNNSGKVGVADTADFGRENVTQDARDRYHFRTPSLLNIAQTAPYGHAGTYQTLEEVVFHYITPRGAVSRFSVLTT